MGEFAPTTIIIFVLLGACVAIGMAYAMARILASPSEFDSNACPASDEQKEYMREVRGKNQDVLWEDAKALRREGKLKRPLREVSIQESSGAESSVFK